MNNFEKQLWCRLQKPTTKDDLAARDIFARKSTKKQRSIVRLLSSISDPLTRKRKEAAKELSALLKEAFSSSGPRRKELQNLRRRLRTLGRDLREMFEGNPRWSAKSEVFLKLAEDCDLRSKDLAYRMMALAMDSTPRRATLTWKGFFKHIPLVGLYWELDVPQTVPYREAEALIRCAYAARNRPWPHKVRYFEREHRHFISKFGTLLDQLPPLWQ
jgi:hypothetical protein